MTTIRILIWLLYIAADVVVNYYIIEEKKSRPNYIILFIARGGAFMLYASLVWGFQYEIWYSNIVLYCLTSFWLVFDLSLNLSRGKHALYIGPTSGWIDRAGIKYTGLYYFCKLAALVFLVLSIINIYMR